MNRRSVGRGTCLLVLCNPPAYYDERKTQRKQEKLLQPVFFLCDPRPGIGSSSLQELKYLFSCSGSAVAGHHMRGKELQVRQKEVPEAASSLIRIVIIGGTC